MIPSLLKTNIEDKAVGCLVGGAIGDALGAGVEGMSPSHLKSRYPAGVKDYVTYGGISGGYTDDTQLSIIVAESYAKFGRFNPDFFSQELIKWDSYKVGEGKACRESAQRLKKGASWQTSGDTSSIGNGAAMRSAPVGIYRRDNLSALAEESKLHTIATHRTKEAVAGSMAVAYAVAYVFNHKKIDVDKFVDDVAGFVHSKSPEFAKKIRYVKKLKNRSDGASVIGTGGRADETVASALYYFVRNPDDFEAAVLSAVNGGGDTDTIAAIVGNISGAYNGYSRIPERFKQGLTNSGKGKDYLIGLAKQIV